MAYAMAFAILLLGSAPAFATPSIVVPEPSDMALFGAAVVGLLIARRAGRPPNRDDRD